MPKTKGYAPAYFYSSSVKKDTVGNGILLQFAPRRRLFFTITKHAGEKATDG